MLKDTVRGIVPDRILDRTDKMRLPDSVERVGARSVA
jgi:hypothetical protein